MSVDRIETLVSAGARRDQRGDHVVGLAARHFEHGNLVGVDELADERHLQRKVFGLRVAVRLVLGVERAAAVAAPRASKTTTT